MEIKTCFPEIHYNVKKKTKKKTGSTQVSYEINEIKEGKDSEVS